MARTQWPALTIAAMPIVEWRAFVAIMFSTFSRANAAVGFSYILNVNVSLEPGRHTTRLRTA